MKILFMTGEAQSQVYSMTMNMEMHSMKHQAEYTKDIYITKGNSQLKMLKLKTFLIVN